VVSRTIATLMAFGLLTLTNDWEQDLAGECSQAAQCNPRYKCNGAHLTTRVTGFTGMYPCQTAPTRLAGSAMRARPYVPPQLWVKASKRGLRRHSPVRHRGRT
jgi:hypothetical protein